MTMNFREALGLVLIVIALAMVPAAWAFSHYLWLLAVVLLVVGAGLFYTERMERREELIAGEGDGRKFTGKEMPSDIHGSSGWRSGGRSESFESESGSGGEGD